MTPRVFQLNPTRRRPGRTWPVLLLVGGLLHAQPTNPPPAGTAEPARGRGEAVARGEPAARGRRADYSAFRVIAERNIFNAARSGGRATAPPREARRPARVDTLALVGVMSYEKGTFAFFDGSSGEFRKATRAGGTVGDFKVVDIRPERVQLENGTNRFELRVGARLRREDQGPWQLSESTEPLPGTGSAGASAASAPAEGSNGGAADEVLRRLLQRREQETR